MVIVVLLSSKSCFSCWGTAFFEGFTLFVGVLACFLRRVPLHAVLSAFLASSKVYFTCGVAWLVGLLGLLRGGLLSLAFSVSINKLKIYK